MEQQKIITRFSIRTMNGRPVISTLQTGATATGFIIEMQGNSVRENVKQVLDYVYEEAYQMVEGFSAVKRGGDWGYVNMALVEVVVPTYNSVENVSEGFAVVSKGGKYGFLKMIGSATPSRWTELEFDQANSFCNGMARVKVDGLYGYIGSASTCKKAIPCQYEEAYDFDSVYPCAVVKAGGKYGVIGKSGEWVVEPKFDTYLLYSRYNGRATYNATIGDKYYYVSADGSCKEVEG